ncbi:MAG TPA: hypothetical protein ENH55_13230 [Aurantimonas coralicida]|uniref:Uncharacterized protein n=1 Tax=Aurantimonas coralicida TaxID=182270 RepID=A0A9C9ND50_9HYPH|nr:hypothetical protein [Aurantimonas coralicida]HET99677.1 hypothetical protein [Aurantimonas coralicida]
MAEGGGEGEDEPQPTPTIFPDNWRALASGGDPKTEQYLGRYASFGNVVKALMAFRQKMSAGELQATKPDGTDEEVLNEWRAQAGIPAEPEGYLERLPEGLIIGESDQPLVASYLTAMHAADAPPAYVHEGLKWYYANEERLLTEQTEADKTNRAQNEDELRAEWGPEYRPNLNGVHGLFDSHGVKGLKEKFFAARLNDGTPFGDDPDILRFLAWAAREINPHGTVTPAPGETPLQTIQAEKTPLEALMSDKNSEYWKGPKASGLQARWRELDEMEQRHKSRAT